MVPSGDTCRDGDSESNSNYRCLQFENEKLGMV